jgi:hypothetical protein
MRRKAGHALGLLLILGITAGCGDSGGNGDAQVASAGKGSASAGASASQGQGSSQDALLAYAKCMRENGVPDFPDPNVGSDGGVSLDMPSGTDPKVAAAAQDACKSLLPTGDTTKADPETTKKLLAYAKCMRAAGITNFPDPAADGHLQLNGNELDMNDPKYQAADQQCATYLPKTSGGPATQSQGAGSGA